MLIELGVDIEEIENPYGKGGNTLLIVLIILFVVIIIAAAMVAYYFFIRKRKDVKTKPYEKKATYPNLFKYDPEK